MYQQTPTWPHTDAPTLPESTSQNGTLQPSSTCTRQRAQMHGKARSSSTPSRRPFRPWHVCWHNWKRWQLAITPVSAAHCSCSKTRQTTWGFYLNWKQLSEFLQDCLPEQQHRCIRQPWSAHTRVYWQPKSKAFDRAHATHAVNALRRFWPIGLHQTIAKPYTMPRHIKKDGCVACSPLLVTLPGSLDRIVKEFQVALHTMYIEDRRRNSFTCLNSKPAALQIGFHTQSQTCQNSWSCACVACWLASLRLSNRGWVAVMLFRSCSPTIWNFPSNSSLLCLCWICQKPSAPVAVACVWESWRTWVLLPRLWILSHTRGLLQGILGLQVVWVLFSRWPNTGLTDWFRRCTWFYLHDRTRILGRRSIEPPD